MLFSWLKIKVKASAALIQQKVREGGRADRSQRPAIIKEARAEETRCIRLLKSLTTLLDVQSGMIDVVSSFYTIKISKEDGFDDLLLYSDNLFIHYLVLRTFLLMSDNKIELSKNCALFESSEKYFNIMIYTLYFYLVQVRKYYPAICDLFKDEPFVKDRSLLSDAAQGLGQDLFQDSFAVQDQDNMLIVEDVNQLMPKLDRGYFTYHEVSELFQLRDIKTSAHGGMLVQALQHLRLFKGRADLEYRSQLLLCIATSVQILAVQKAKFLEQFCKLVEKSSHPQIKGQQLFRINIVQDQMQLLDLIEDFPLEAYRLEAVSIMGQSQQYYVDALYNAVTSNILAIDLSPYLCFFQRAWARINLKLNPKPCPDDFFNYNKSLINLFNLVVQLGSTVYNNALRPGSYQQIREMYAIFTEQVV